MKNIFANIKATGLVALLFFFFLSTSFLVSQAPQQQEKVVIDENAALSDLLAAAALNNAGLKAAFERWQAALNRIPQVRALPNPQLTYAYFIREVETRVGPQQHKLGIMQKFPWFGKRKLKGNAALEMASAEKQRYENVKLNLFYRVKEAYFEYYYVTKTITVLKENVQLLKYLEEVVRAKYRTGSALYANLLKIQVELDKLQDRLKSAVDVLEPVKARLNAALNRPLNSLLPVPGEILPEAETRSLQISRDVLKELAEKNNPGLKAIDAMAAKEKITIKLAKKNYFPDFSIGIDYMITGETGMPGVTDKGKDPVAVMASIGLPLWAKKNKAAVKEANARYRAAVSQQKEQENNLLARLEMVFFKYRDAERKMALYRDTLLPRAKQALEVVRSSFETGKADFLDFIDSQRTLLEFELTYEEAKTHSAQRLAELQMLTGNEKIGKWVRINQGGSFRENLPPGPPAKAFDKGKF